MMDQKKSFVHLLMLLIFLSALLSQTRSELMRQRAVEDAKHQVFSSREMQKGRRVLANEKMERMDIEINDYPGSGANSRHDPRNPGRP